MKFVKKLVYRNEPAIQGEINQLRTQKEYFQKLVDKLVENGIEVTTDGLKQLIENPKAFIVIALTKGENLKVGSLSIDNNKLFDLMEIPSEITSLIETIEKTRQTRGENEFYLWKVSLFSVNENVVEISKEHLECLEKQHSVFLETENQEKAYNILENVANQLNELPKYGLSASLENDFFKVGFENKLVINIHIIRRVQ